MGVAAGYSIPEFGRSAIVVTEASAALRMGTDTADNGIGEFNHGGGLARRAGWRSAQNDQGLEIGLSMLAGGDRQ